MSYKIIQNKAKLVSEYLDYCNTRVVNEDKLDGNHLKIRKFFLEKYYHYKGLFSEKYLLDVNLALDFYEFLNSQKDFNRIYESNYDFWKYIAVCVIPDIVEDRHGLDSIKYFYEKSVAIYPFVLYWYIHLSWQGDKESTYETIKDFSTDEIMQLVERPSKIGINLELYRNIMKKYSSIEKSKRNVIINGKNKSLFRVILIKNTSKLASTRPEIYPGGVSGYIEMLFNNQ